MRSERSPEPTCDFRSAARSASARWRSASIEFRAQHLHGDGAVLVLGFLRRGHDDAGGNMGDAHRRIGGVDMLTHPPRSPASCRCGYRRRECRSRPPRPRAAPPPSPPRCGCAHPIRSPAPAAPGARRIRTSSARKTPSPAMLATSSLSPHEFAPRLLDDGEFPALRLGITAGTSSERSAAKSAASSPPCSGPDLEDRRAVVGLVFGRSAEAHRPLGLGQHRVDAREFFLGNPLHLGSAIIASAPGATT